MSVGFLFALLAAADPSASPTLNDAIVCAHDLGKSAALPPDGLIRLATEAQNQCESRYSDAIQQSIQSAALSSSASKEFIRANIDARIRIEAVSQIIDRLEGGELLPTRPDDSGQELSVIRRYVECSRLASYRKANSVYLGDKFPQMLKGKNQAEVDNFFVSEARSACPITRTHALTATDSYLRANGEADAARRKRDVEASMTDTEIRSVRPLTSGLLQPVE